MCISLFPSTFHNASAFYMVFAKCSCKVIATDDANWRNCSLRPPFCLALYIHKIVFIVYSDFQTVISINIENYKLIIITTSITTSDITTTT